MNKIKKALKTYGLNNQEIEIYLHLLARIESSAYKLSKELNIPRSSIYDKLKSLQEKGLVAMSRVNNVKHYTPESLNNFLTNLEEQKEAIQSIIPDLKKISNKATLHKPKVNYYVGKNEMKYIWEQMIDSYTFTKTKKVYATSHKKLFDLFPRYMQTWIERRKKLGISAHLIRPASDRLSLNNKYELDRDTIRFINDDYLSQSEITTFGDKTAIFLFEEHKPQTIVIESKEITDIFNKLLQFMWQKSEK